MGQGNDRKKETLAAHHNVLEAWWAVARDDFAGLRDGKKMPDVRHELLTTLKGKLIPLNVLDEFKSAGVFVNWWQQIRYDLKTIISTGWHHSLISDDYLIAAFFQAETDEIEALEARIGEAQSELAEAVETAQEVAAYEPEEDESVTAAVIKKALKELIDDLRGSTGESARKERETLQARLARTDAILAAIGGPLTDEEARGLILKKLYDLAAGELNRYLNAEKRGLIAVVENLWDKYAVSSRELERERAETLKTLDKFLKGLGYLEKDVDSPGKVFAIF